MHKPTHAIRTLVTTTMPTMAALLATTLAAAAADMQVKAPRRPPPPPPVAVPVVVPFSWSGIYIGGNIGGAWSQLQVTDALHGVNFGNGNNGSFIGGGQVGANYQMGNLVLGVEGTFDGVANNNNSMAGVVIPNVGTVRVNDRDRWIATAAARFGIAFDRILAYGKAGGGWVGTDNFSVTNVTTGTTIAATNNTTTQGGWLVGGGLEWAFTDSLSAKVEYDFLGLGNRSFTLPATAAILPGDTFNVTKHDVQMATVGLNYRFNWGVPRY